MSNESSYAYFPYTLEGEFTSDECETIAAAFRKHVPEHVDAGFNNWQVVKFSEGKCYVRRATWENGRMVDTAEDVAELITGYYTTPGRGR